LPAGDCQLSGIIHARNAAGEDVGLETGRVEEVVLEELAGEIGLGAGLHGQDAVRPLGHAHKLIA